MVLEKREVEIRYPNWLPLPYDVFEENAPLVEEDDLFSKGEIISFHSRQGMGSVKNAKGEELSFDLKEAVLIGPKREKRYIAEGRRVGYDVAWTSNGVHITKLKIY